MAQKRRKSKKQRQRQPAASKRPAPVRQPTRASLFGLLRSAADGLLHRQEPEAPLWRYFWPVLALAFAVRAAVALSGDFIMRPDELMQYLEPAHHLAFGNGILFWEYFYGARLWLLPGLIAGLLKAFDAVGLGQPFWYVGGVKLVFCALSLAIPAGMYFFARWHLGETTARVALLAGAFWYELVGFAHKPLTGMVATALLMCVLALCMRTPASASETSSASEAGEKSGAMGWRFAWLVAFLTLLATAFRIQYAPFALVLWGLCFVRMDNPARIHLVAASAIFFLAVGVFDALTWDGALFHSYLTNIRFNLELWQTAAAGASPAHQYLWWLLLASTGGSALCVALALRQPRRYGFLLLLIGLVLLSHSLQTHKEYRYVFVAIPLWLLLGSGVVAHFLANTKHPTRICAASAALFATVSLAGILNALPRQEAIYQGPHQPREIVVRFLRGQDPHFAAFRYLAEAPNVSAIWAPGRYYHSLPGYYYLHRPIPFYDTETGRLNNLHQDVATLQASVSHLVVDASQPDVPGYEVEKEFGPVRILRRQQNDAPVRNWQSFTPIIADTFVHRIVQAGNPDAPAPPPNSGIRFAE